MPSPTDARASPPDQLADAGGELPEEVTDAIESLIAEAEYEGGRWSISDRKDINRARAALATTILSRLTAAEAQRDAAIRERDEALRISAEALELVRKYAVEAMTAEAAQEEPWRPIETAPKDQSEVLLSGPSYDDPSAGESYVVVGGFYRGAWRDAPDASELHPPTHWKPLPAPPTSAKET